MLLSFSFCSMDKNTPRCDAGGVSVIGSDSRVETYFVCDVASIGDESVPSQEAS
ncbi:hypothetical protein R5M92_05495 [Halomonas sp. Bachu 37]|uniref:hypothetical protein n=1 Tax=Halomonas kashgarensis TaxID=3084920 RepID=UPI0032165DA3